MIADISLSFSQVRKHKWRFVVNSESFVTITTFDRFLTNVIWISGLSKRERQLHQQQPTKAPALQQRESSWTGNSLYWDLFNGKSSRRETTSNKVFLRHLKFDYRSTEHLLDNSSWIYETSSADLTFVWLVWKGVGHLFDVLTTWSCRIYMYLWSIS